MTPLYSCPIERQDKDQLLSELCNIGDDGKWESNRLNEMIILAKYEKLPPESTDFIAIFIFLIIRIIGNILWMSFSA